jgi:demethylmenaquinone methyltransferase/2-methoxy-6-polyprenyl-1,4-benzoquinol methylase
MKGRHMNQADFTDFGFEKVSPQEKRDRVADLFDSVAPGYDIMNDLMSFGVHRIWKRYVAGISGIRPGNRILDVAGGTGDMAGMFSTRTGRDGYVTICDISHEMLEQGRNRLLDKGIPGNVEFVQGDAENLPFRDKSFDLINIAFGLRNITDKPAALRSIYSKLKYGSKLIILEFSKVTLPVLQGPYTFYSNKYIPLLGRLIAGDEPSYRYLVESIRMHPDQETLKTMIENAGFSRVRYNNLSGGIVAVHTAYKL